MGYAARNIAYSGLSYLVHFGKAEYAFQKLTYGDKIDGVEWLTHLGSQEQKAKTRGVYKVDEIKASMLVAEWDAMMVNFPSNGFCLVTFPITITGADPELPTRVDRLLDCSMISEKADIEATGKAGMIEFGITCRQIVWNGRTINVRRNAPNNGANNRP